jgi:predicted transposase YbfD/YdcC
VIAIDGKTLRRSFDRAASCSALQVVTAFAAEARVVIGQVASADKEGEIKAARALLGLIDLKGALVTGDALHCQGDTARLINQRGGDWLFTLKQNRPVQHDEVTAWFADPLNQPEPKHVTTDADHGRIEVRRHWRQPRYRLDAVRPAPSGRGGYAGSCHHGDGRGDGDPRRQDQYVATLLSVLGMARCAAVRRRRAGRG